MTTSTTAPSRSPRAPRPLGTALRTVLRGVSQIFFLENSLSGALILGALALMHPWAAVTTALGSAVQALCSAVRHPDETEDDLRARAVVLGDEVRHGIMGYNGALVGAAAALVFAPTPLTAVLATVVGAAACVPVHMLVARLFATRPLRSAGLPVSTAPFCLTAGMLTLLTAALAGPSAPLTSSGSPWPGLGLGLLNSFAEVVLADGALPGALILAALFVGSWRVGLYGLFGAVASFAAARLIVGHELTDVSTGLWGYSSVLVAIALGAVVPGLGGWRRRVPLVVVGVALSLAFQHVLVETAIPVFTWPFLLGMWATLLLVAGARRAAGRG